MDFFEHQDSARRRTGWLIAYFVLAVAGIVAAIYLIVVFGLGMMDGQDSRTGPSPYEGFGWHPDVLLIVAVATMGVIALGSLYKTSQLASGGEAVALMMGGRLIDGQTDNLAERRLLNVVEEMAIASGIPVPPVYVMDGEPSINAFAAGFEPADAVIGVSRGALTYLERDEIQGVIAHEFSHILNGDMRLNIRLVGILHGILILAVIGWYVLRSMGLTGRRSRGGDKGGGALALILMIGVGLLVVGSIGLFFGRLIKSAVSRQREYLADASAVQFTRLPDGIAGALKKIGGVPETSKIEDAHAEEISHMFFGSAFGSFRWQLFATHPPLADRVQRIDPSFDGNFPKKVLPVRITAQDAERKQTPAEKKQALDALEKAAGAPVDPSGILQRVGVPGLEQIVAAAAILESIPDPLQSAAHEPYGARAVIYALLLDRDQAMRDKQWQALREKAEVQSYQETERLAPVMDQLGDTHRLALVDVAMPALKKLSDTQYVQFRDNVDALIQADEKMDLLEYAVQLTVVRTLNIHFGLVTPPAVRYRRWEPLIEPMIDVLSVLAHTGARDEDQARRAFDAAWQRLGRTASIRDRSDCTLKRFDSGLAMLAQAAPRLKRDILGACIACVTADRSVSARESQLVRAVAANLGVPLPPIASQT